MIIIKFIAYPVLGDGIENSEFIISSFLQGISHYNVYFICVEKGGNTLLHLYHSVEVPKPLYKHGASHRIAIGVAAGRHEAFQLAGDILLDYYKAHGSFQGFRESYLNCRRWGDNGNEL